MPEKQLKPANWAIRRIGVSPQRFYGIVREGNIFPPGTIVRLGRTIMVDPERLEEFIAAGGAALPGGWRREAQR